MNRQSIVLTVVVLLLWALFLPASAQEEGPLREGERQAPERAPTVLSREEVSPGTVQIVLEIPAAAGSYVASERPFRNFGSAALFVGYNLVGDAFGAERSLLRFDVDPFLPAGAVINEAHVQLRLSFAAPSDDLPMPTVMRALQGPWNESTVTWASQPAAGNVYAAADVGTAMTWYEWEVTGLVEAWADDTLPNYGVIIIGDERVQERERVFHSRETTTGYYPRLVVDYTVTGDTEPPTTTVDSLPAYSPRTFTVSWSGSDEGTGIATYDVQFRVDGGAWQNWFAGVTFTSAEFTGESGRTYAFRARAEDIAGNVEDFGDAEASTTVDAAAPEATMNALPSISDAMTFVIGWSGEDELSGIAYYDVRYRVNGGAWQLWQSQTLATSVPFTAQVDGIYDFEARAVDEVGNVEPFKDVAEVSIAVDAVAPFIEPSLYLPLIRKD